MRLAIVFVVAAGMAAQEGPDFGILRGELLEWEATGAAGAGELSVRGPDHKVYRCSFDGATFLERDRGRVAASSVRAGESVELVAHHGPAGACRALTVYVLSQPAPRPSLALRRSSLARLRSLPGTSFPRGDVNLAGLVLRRTPEQIVLKTRTGGTTTVLLREDTGFAADGLAVDLSRLALHTQVYVRAGRNLDGDLEAYQVVWGDILTVR